MEKLTQKEILVLRAFAQVSIDSCGQFNDDENMSWANAQDIAEETGLSIFSASGVMGSLTYKGWIMDSGDSPRGAKINDFTASPKMFADHNDLKDLYGDFPSS